MRKIIFIFIMMIASYGYSQTINETLKQQSELIENVKNEFVSIMISVENLKNENSNLLIEKEEMKKLIANSIEKINCLEENIFFLKKALSSNKDDESQVINELGNIFMELEKYKEYISSIEKKLNDVSVFINIAIPLTTIPIMCCGIYEFANGNESVGKLMMYSSAGLFFGLELTYQSGRFIFKKW